MTDLRRHSISRPGHTDIYITALAAQALGDRPAISAFFADLAAHLQGRTGQVPVEVLHARFYGLSPLRAEILEAAAQAFGDGGSQPAFPITFIDGAPCVGGWLAGASLVGVASRDASVHVERITSGDQHLGSELRTAAMRSVLLAGVSGLEASGHGESAGPGPQADRMFRRAATLLEARGLRASDIARTWIYMPHLLDWYDVFNRARNACFREIGVLDSEGRGRLPASTGIQGRRSPAPAAGTAMEEACFMDVLALRRADGGDASADIVQMRNPRQNEAPEYGSAFSRGMAVGDHSPRTLHISGTAAIDEFGQSVRLGDAAGQVLLTLEAVEALLGSQGATLHDIRLATAYCKDLATYDAFRSVVAKLGIDAVPFVPVLADVCRAELLFEMDCVAVAGPEAAPLS